MEDQIERFMTALRAYVEENGQLAGDSLPNLMKRLPPGITPPRPLKKTVERHAEAYGLRLETRPVPVGWVVILRNSPSGAFASEAVLDAGTKEQLTAEATLAEEDEDVVAETKKKKKKKRKSESSQDSAEAPADGDAAMAPVEKPAEDTSAPQAMMPAAKESPLGVEESKDEHLPDASTEHDTPEATPMRRALAADSVATPRSHRLALTPSRPSSRAWWGCWGWRERYRGCA